MAKPFTFLFKNLLFILSSCALLYAGTYVISLLFKDFNAESYFLAVIDKHENFKKKNANKNLIVVGGSASAFGIDSEILSRATDLDVMNFGVHGDFGWEFYISEAELESEQGDVVLVNIEYELTGNKVKLGNLELYQMFFESKGAGLKYGSPSHFVNILFNGGEVIRQNTSSYINAGTRTKHPVYHRGAFDKNGDLQSQPEYSKSNLDCEGKSAFLKKDFTFGDNYINALADLKENLEDRGGRLLVSFPPSASSSYNALEAQKLFLALEKNSFEVLCPPSEMLFCDSLFVGTDYHLSKSGRDIYTKKLSKAIQPFLK